MNFLIIYFWLKHIGHKSTITCLHLAPSGQWLSTGSDDNSVNLWQVDVALMEVNECRLRYRFKLVEIYFYLRDKNY